MNKLLQINVSANWGSHGRIAEGIGQLAMANGWESYIAYGRYAQPSQSKLIKIGNKWNQAIHLMQTRLFDDQGLASAHATKHLIETINQIKPNIVHLHNIHGYYLNYPLLFKWLNDSNVHTVWTFHDCWPFTGHCAHFTDNNCYKWINGCHDCKFKYVYPKSYYDRSERNYLMKKKYFSSLNNLTIITVSNWLKSVTEKSFFKNKKIKTIYNGIDVSTFNITNTEHSQKNKFKILCIANVWSKAKGFNDIIQLRTKLPIQEYDIIIVGLNKSQIKNLPCGIIGIERTNSTSDLVDLYNNADVLFNPSTEETFGMVTAEALACGTPAIVYNSTACPEIVSEDTGFVVKPNDINSVECAILKIRNLTKSHYSQNCRKRVLAKFNKHDRFKEYIELYSDLLRK